MSARRTPPIERVMARSVAGPNACILWTGWTTPQGYGQVAVDGRAVGVHRVAYLAFHGPIAPGLEIDHQCRVRNCVNPHHLVAMTHIENVRRALRRTEGSAQACRRGHELTEDNVFLRRDGARECRVCKRNRNSAYKARRRSAANGAPIGGAS